MGFQRVPETVSVTIVFRCVNKEVSNIYYAEKAGGYSLSDIQGLAAEVDANVAPNFAALMSVDDAYLRTEVKGLDAEFDLSASVNTSTVIGSLGADPQPNNVSFCVSQRSGLSGRSARGRVYICGLPTNVMKTTPYGDENKLTLAAANAYVGVVDGARIAIDNFTTWNPVLVSRYANGTKRTEAITFPWVSSDFTTQLVATRRNRIR